MLVQSFSLIKFDYRILTDLDAPKGAHLMGPHEEGSLNIVTLMLTGRATPYLVNDFFLFSRNFDFILFSYSTMEWFMLEMRIIM